MPLEKEKGLENGISGAVLMIYDDELKCFSALNLTEKMFLTGLLSVQAIDEISGLLLRRRLLSVIGAEANQGRHRWRKEIPDKCYSLFFLISFLPFLHFKSSKAERRGKFVLFPLTPQRG